MLSATSGARWEIGIGDPTFTGWVTVVAYFLAAYQCVRAAVHCRRSGDESTLRETCFWATLGFALVLLGVNKQLDLQTALTQYARDHAIAHGWYEGRRVVQKWFIGIIAVTGFLSIPLLGWLLRDCFRRCWLAIVGFTVLVCFVVIRAASFHHVDHLLGWHGLGLSFNAILELGGITCIALSASDRLATWSVGQDAE